MNDEEKGLGVASDVLKQLITLCTAIVAATLALFLANKSSSVSHWWPIATSISGALCVLSSLLFLTDLSATALGSCGNTGRVRLRIFVFTWALFFLCALVAAAYVLKLTGVV